jgi:hypothetical protein
MAGVISKVNAFVNLGAAPTQRGWAPTRSLTKAIIIKRVICASIVFFIKGLP